jgi:hypothetical protein
MTTTLLVNTFGSFSARADDVATLDSLDSASDLDLAKEASAKLEACQAKSEIDRLMNGRLCQARMLAVSERGNIRVKAEREKAKIRIEALTKKVKATEKARIEAERAAERSWYESPPMWFWGGLVVGIGGGFLLAVGSTWGVSQLTQTPLTPVLVPPAE